LARSLGRVSVNVWAPSRACVGPRGRLQPQGEILQGLMPPAQLWEGSVSIYLQAWQNRSKKVSTWRQGPAREARGSPGQHWKQRMGL
jgi:hypothetical protein